MESKEIPQDEFPKSYLASKSRIRVGDLLEAKLRREKWAMLTSYDSISAKIFEKAKMPCLLVGDSASQIIYGNKTTLPITMDELVPLARAVASSCERTLVVADLPFGVYQESPEAALRAAVRFMKEAKVQAIKLEGGKEFAGHVRLLTNSGVPVVAHIGFTPQSENTLSGYKVQGRGGQEARDRILGDALALQEAGAFACVLELMPSDVAEYITKNIKIPTIGIGAGPHCDAQILVWTDMAGFTPPRGGGYMSEAPSSSDPGKKALELNRVPKFVKKYANMSEILYNAVLSYSNDVSMGKYPSEEHSYKN